MDMSKVHEEGYLKFDAVGDGEPVQLPQCRPDVIQWRKKRNNPGRGILNMLQWGYGRPRQSGKN